MNEIVPDEIANRLVAGETVLWTARPQFDRVDRRPPTPAIERLRRFAWAVGFLVAAVLAGLAGNFWFQHGVWAMFMAILTAGLGLATVLAILNATTSAPADVWRQYMGTREDLYALTDRRLLVVSDKASTSLWRDALVAIRVVANGSVFDVEVFGRHEDYHPLSLLAIADGPAVEKSISETLGISPQGTPQGPPQ